MTEIRDDLDGFARARAALARVTAIKSAGATRPDPAPVTDPNLAALIDAGNRLANVLENSAPARTLRTVTVARALERWDLARDAYGPIP